MNKQKKRMQQLLDIYFFIWCSLKLQLRLKIVQVIKPLVMLRALIWMTDCLTLVDFHHWRDIEPASITCDRDYYDCGNAVIVIVFVINHYHNVQGCNKCCMTKSNTEQMPLKTRQWTTFISIYIWYLTKIMSYYIALLFGKIDRINGAINTRM